MQGQSILDMAVVMTKNERRCFEAAMRWQRRQLVQELGHALVPRLPFLHLLTSTSAITKLLYTMVVLVLLPLLAVIWLLRSLVQIIALPYRIALTHTSPRGLKAPGERNIQGIHNAFTRHFDLSPENYVNCVNDWIAILYSEEALEFVRMDQLVNLKRLEQSVFTGVEVPIPQLRNTLSQARETLSKKLGHYS